MRTVLAVDEMLAVAVKRRLEGEAEVFDRMKMRDLGRRKVPGRLRELVTERPSVLVIGGREWDALPTLRAARIPREVPVVLLTPKATWERHAEASRLGVVAMVPTDDGTDTREAIVDEVRIAWAFSPPLVPVIVERSRRAPVSSSEASLAVPRVPAWERWAAKKTS